MPRLNLAEKIQLFLNFSLWNFIDCGSWTIQCLKINNFKVSLHFTGTADDCPRSAAPRVASKRQDNMIRHVIDVIDS